LLAQHENLRELLRDSLQLAEAMGEGTVAPERLASRLDELRGAFAEHNSLEASLLEPLISSGDAWAPARLARMIEEHGAEHLAFTAFFAQSLAGMAHGLVDFAEDVEAHMAAEERTFLSPSVLRDSLVTDGGSGS